MTASDISNKFKTLLSNLRTLNHELVVMRRENITRRLNQDYWSSLSKSDHCRHVGSYGRGTEIRGASDVDLMFRLPDGVYYQYNAYTGNGQSALLQAFRNSIQKTYASTRVGGDGQVVVVEFGDGMKFEINPVFSRSDGAFTFPDSNDGGRWRKVDPLPEIRAINEANNRSSKKVKHLARMTRAWKKENGVAMSGLLIDTLVQDFMVDWGEDDKSYHYYDWMARDFLKYLHDQDRARQYWHAPGSNQRVYRDGPFEYKAGQGHQAALKAIEHEEVEQHYSANQQWKKIYGGPFPL